MAQLFWHPDRLFLEKEIEKKTCKTQVADDDAAADDDDDDDDDHYNNNDDHYNNNNDHYDEDGLVSGLS